MWPITTEWQGQQGGWDAVWAAAWAAVEEWAGAAVGEWAGALERPLSILVATILSVLVFFVGWRVFRIAQPLIAERV